MTVVLGPAAWGEARDQVVVGNIPQQPPGFQPRPYLMRQLNRAPAGVPIVLTGRRGTGKTQLAAAYARAKLGAEWRLVAWLNAADFGSLLAGLGAVADAAGLSDGSSPQDAAEVSRLVRHRLEADGKRCLLVFDDAEDPDLLQPFVPASGAAQVLIISTRQSMGDLGTSIAVDVFSAEEALALLDGRTGLADDEGAAVVAAELGYLPLALAQASAMIAGQRLRYWTYLQRLRSLSVQQYLSRRDGPPYPHGVAEAVVLSLDAARAGDQGDVCTAVMEIMAVLSEGGVSRDLLYATGRDGALARHRRRPRVSAELVDRALIRLLERSLLNFSLDGQTVIAHCQVMQVVRDMLARQERLAAVCRAAASVLDARAAALAASRDHAAVRAILEQMTALRDNAAGAMAETDDELAKVLLSMRFWMLHHFNKLGDSAPQAIAVGEPLVADFEQVLGPDHPDTLTARNSLAAAYQAAGRAGEAIPLYEQSLVACERLLGVDHPRTLNSRSSLAVAYAGAGRLGEAIPLLKRTVAGREQVLGHDHRDTVKSRSNLASAYRDAGRVAEAIPLLERTVAGQERVLGPDHPDTLTAQNNLAAAYRSAGWVAEAIPLFEQTVAVQDRVLGANHLSTLTTRHNLANAYLDVGRVAESVTLHEQTLAACEWRLGDDHAKTLAARNNLAAAYRAAGRSAEAIPLFERNLIACERLLGADHPRTLSTRQNLIAAHQEAAQAEAAGHDGQPALVDQVGGDFQHDRAQLVRIAGLLEIDVTGRADRQDGAGGADPVAQRGVGAGQQVDERVQPAAEAGESLLRLHGLHGGPVLLQEPEDLAAGQHHADVTVQDLAAGLVVPRLVLGPVQQGVDLGEVVVGEAVDDVFLGLEVVVQGGLGHAEALGDLAQRGLLVALLGEQLERNLLRPRPGIGPRRRPRVVHVRVSLPCGAGAVIYLTAG
jgi:tetratricopeptide (TPR) repeat protein